MSTMGPALDGNIANVKDAVKSDWLKVVRAEERSNFLRELVREGLGTNDVENFVTGQGGLRVNVRGRGRERAVELDRENVINLMKAKLDNSGRDEEERRRKRNKGRARLERLLGKNKNRYRKFINTMREMVARERKKLRSKNKNKVRAIRMKRKQIIREVLPHIIRRYVEARIFKEDGGGFKPGEVKGPVIVGEDSKLLSKDEVAVLMRGPKFTVRRALSKERFLIEMEKSYIKVRWAKRDEDEIEEDKEPETEEEERVRLAGELESARSRMVFNPDTGSVDFRKERCTDAKHNTRVILPGPLTQAQESELIMRRVEWEAVYEEYIREMCDEEGVQESNLTREEERGLKSLKKRVADGSIVICATDKSSRFAIMTMAEYEEAGKKHTSKDEEVDDDFLVDNEKRLNGHISMMLKTFMVGSSWRHEARHRATKITHSKSIAPMYLLFKDHKLWTVDMGGAPPTRPVCSAGGGQNDHLSEGVSQLLEPVVSVKESGMEVTSTPDMVSVIVGINKKDLKPVEMDNIKVEEELEALEKELEEIDETDLEQVDIEIDLTSDNGPVLRAGPAENIRKTAKQDMHTHINILRARWASDKHKDMKNKLEELVDKLEEGNDVKEEVVNWLVSSNDKLIIENAWEKLAEMEYKIDSTNLTEDNDHQQTLHLFVELLVEHARAWHMDDDDGLEEQMVGRRLDTTPSAPSFPGLEEYEYGGGGAVGGEQTGHYAIYSHPPQVRG